jgi:DNA replication and repair protein RecF
MQVEALGVENFRNLSGEIIPGPGLNIFSGENGQGKTNWLEAIGILASVRSFRTARLQDAIRFDAEMAVVWGTVRESAGITRELRVAVTAGTKTALVNGKKEVINRYLGQLHAVVFNADELETIRGQPDARRRFLDAGIISLHPPFIRVFTDYKSVIKQKSALLQSRRDAGDSLEKISEALIPWNEQLATLAGKIHRARMRFVERLNEVLERRLFSRESLSIRYQSSLEDRGDLTDYHALISERLALRVQAELIAGYALVGPHRDDLEITFDGHDLRKFGSAGQQRSALLLLQLANIAVYHATRGEYPLFLIDDIDAELDYGRIGALLEFLSGKTQTFVTTSKENFVERFSSNSAVLRIAHGRVEI